EEEAFAFYAKYFPLIAVSFKSLKPSFGEPEIDLRFDISDRLNALKPYEKEYPDAMILHGKTYSVTYLFEPGDPHDGATLHIPLSDLPKLSDPILHPHAGLEFVFLIENDEGKPMARSTSIRALKKHFSAVLDTLVNSSHSPFGQSLYTDWSFGDLPQSIEHSFPALTPAMGGVQIKLYHDQAAAKTIHAEGVLALAKMHFSKELKALKADLKVLSALSKMSFIQDKTKLTDEFLGYALARFFGDHNQDLQAIRTQAQFHALLALKGTFYAYQLQLQKWLESLSTPILDIRVQLKSLSHKQGLAQSVIDLQNQFIHLCQPHFFKETPLPFLQRYPVYFKGIQLRIQRLINNPERELRLFAEFESVRRLAEIAK
ncbi:MAG TPA: DUF3418 domain-containing protein, partial [bacterium]|nr:DUF3418 domain-containing protein [bacterium]